MGPKSTGCQPLDTLPALFSGTIVLGFGHAALAPGHDGVGALGPGFSGAWPTRDRIGSVSARPGSLWHLLSPRFTKGANSRIGLEWRLLVRRRILWIYVLVPLVLGLVLPVHEEQGLAEFLPRLVGNLLAFHLPLCAVFAAPILTRSLAPDRDWM